ncbi:MAG: hypothetical protein NVSMB69_08240 [Novosphingobium sp.]
MRTGLVAVLSWMAPAEVALATRGAGVGRATGATRAFDVERAGLSFAAVTAGVSADAGATDWTVAAGGAAAGGADSTTTGAGSPAAAGGAAGLTSCASSGVEQSASDAAIAWNAQDERLIRLVMSYQLTKINMDATVMSESDEA